MSGPLLSKAKLRPLCFLSLDGDAVILYSHLVMASFSDNFGSDFYSFIRKNMFFIVFNLVE